ncbi:hypothetical protein ABKF45_003202 [Escherichia coli]|uniref:Uncharacterized protein n=1 Tax=Escherichia coli TaxID=562 RepID=A0A6D0PKH7_ECOLX|nr:hypothetical protein [Escherichia coli]EFO2070586.1 hypothetical protein [Escherichia coli O8]EKK2473684.1 hypothetical protein [Escherichia coli O91]EED0799461.1 hypothetical protein [Escherichia coli]EEQ9035279.1 hypothetical protein [Escherichia coli]EES5530483.1 hypothetical protein [Escherichia coli]
MNNALALFKGLLIAAIVVVDGWALFQVVSYTLQNCHNGLAIVLMIGVGSIGVLLLTALMAWVIQPAVYLLTFLFAIIGGITEWVLNRRRSHA